MIDEFDLDNNTEKSFLSQYSPDALIRASQSGALKDVPQEYLSGSPDMFSHAADGIIDRIRNNAPDILNTAKEYSPSANTVAGITAISPMLGSVAGLVKSGLDSIPTVASPSYLSNIISSNLETKNQPNNGYQTFNKSSTASGRYQVLDSTWNGYGGYTRAAYAPPEVQDRFMQERMANALRLFNGDPFKAIAYHIYPAYANNPELWNRPLPGQQARGAQTIAGYIGLIVRGTPLEQRYKAYLGAI